MGESGKMMELFTGEYPVTLDEKSRISLPAFLRRCLNETNVWLTKGDEKCLKLYPSAKWNEMIINIMENTESLSANDRALRRRILASSTPVEIDKAGRIPIAQNYREHSNVSKECVVIGQGDYIEIWDEGLYRKYDKASDEIYIAASEELSKKLKNKKGMPE